jgi:hypothetical protein
MNDLATNVLYYGDNRDILRRYLHDAAVDLVYLDPPFNSNRDYNVIFRDESGNATDAPPPPPRAGLAEVLEEVEDAKRQNHGGGRQR